VCTQRGRERGCLCIMAIEWKHINTRFHLIAMRHPPSRPRRVHTRDRIALLSHHHAFPFDSHEALPPVPTLHTRTCVPLCLLTMRLNLMATVHPHLCPRCSNLSIASTHTVQCGILRRRCLEDSQFSHTVLGFLPVPRLLPFFFSRLPILCFARP
jgi:hypothetical protein